MLGFFNGYWFFIKSSIDRLPHTNFNHYQYVKNINKSLRIVYKVNIVKIYGNQERSLQLYNPTLNSI